MGRIFYLDAANGNDKNNGITPDEALKSLEAANRIVFGEGDKLLLKCGCVWKGMLCLHGDGDRFNFAQVGVYGDFVFVTIAAKDVCVREFALVQSQRELQQESKFQIVKSLR